MRFTVAPPGAGGPPPAAAAPPRPRPWTVERDWTSPGTYEPVRATSPDGQWAAERQADGTWVVLRLPARILVKTLRSLPACRRYVGDGRARADLDRILSGKTAGANPHLGD